MAPTEAMYIIPVREGKITRAGCDAGQDHRSRPHRVSIIDRAIPKQSDSAGPARTTERPRRSMYSLLFIDRHAMSGPAPILPYAG
jgi:hypothetical protein